MANCAGAQMHGGLCLHLDGSKEAGKGEQEIKNVIDGERIDIEIRFERPFAGICQRAWDMSSDMACPMNAMLLFMSMDNLPGKTSRQPWNDKIF